MLGNRRIWKLFMSLLLAVLVGRSGLAFAEDGPRNEEDTHHEEDTHTVAITLSPVHLILPVVEFTIEGAPIPSLGIAGILGIGEVDGVSIFEIGASFRYYVVGDFDHGMQLLLEVLYIEAGAVESAAVVAGSGFAAGPMIGYKISADFGLTFEIQFGASYLIAKSNGSSAAADGFLANLNLNLGWAF